MGHPKEKKQEKKRHHYVPQFLIRNFASPLTGRVTVLDKKKMQVRTDVLPDNVFFENHFYRAPDHTGEVSSWFEEKLAGMESVTAPPIDRIIKSKFLDIQSDADRERIAIFAAVQIMRSPLQRRRMESIKELLKMAYADRVPPAELQKEIDEQERHGGTISFSIRFIQTVIADLVIILLAKKWWLYVCDSDFHLGDSGIAWHNLLPNPSGKGGMGLANKGIQICQPISSSFMISMTCSETTEHLMAANHQFARYIFDGEPILISGDVLDMINFLQLGNSARFLVSRSNSFDKAIEILKEDPSLRNGPLFEIVASPPLGKIRNTVEKELKAQGFESSPAPDLPPASDATDGPIFPR